MLKPMSDDNVVVIDLVSLLLLTDNA